LTLSFWLHCGPGVHSASNRNEYQEYFLRGKGGRCLMLTSFPPYVPIVLKSGTLNLLETSGPVQACNGIALPASCYRRTSHEFPEFVAVTSQLLLTPLSKISFQGPLFKHVQSSYFP
jgi:hypothetical protein